MTKQSTPKSASAPQSGKTAEAGADRAQAAPQQMGEGSYEATRDYQKNIGEYMKKADIDADAKAAKPRSEQEARELKRAEEEGLSHAKDSQNAPRK